MLSNSAHLLGHLHGTAEEMPLPVAIRPAAGFATRVVRDLRDMKSCMRFCREDVLEAAGLHSWTLAAGDTRGLAAARGNLPHDGQCQGGTTTRQPRLLTSVAKPLGGTMPQWA